MIQTREEIIRVFDEFRSEIDENNDRRERLIKISREITVQSKRVIFMIHRLANDDAPSRNSAKAADPADTESAQTTTAEPVEESSLLDSKAISNVHAKLHHIRKILSTQLAKELPTVQSYWQHQRNVTPGIQEYIEAVSYCHYLTNNTLITHGEMMIWLSDDSGSPVIPLPYDEFLLGLSDLTGELMRFTITGLARGKGMNQVDRVCQFVRSCKADFERLTPFIWELSKKQQVTKQSLQKIEEVNYAARLRTAEYGEQSKVLSVLLPRVEGNASRHEVRDGEDYEDN